MKLNRIVLAGALSVAAIPLTLGATATATPAVPACIVSLSPSATDTLFAIGAGPQVQAVDQDSNYPAAAAALAKKDHINALAPSFESLLGICKGGTKPNLVILSYNPSDLQQKLQAQGVTVLEQNAPTTVAGAVNQIRQLGQVTGHSQAAVGIAAAMNQSISTAIASVPAHKGRTVSVYYEVSTNPYYSLTSSTFVGSVMKAMGLTNIADAAATSADAGYPSLSSEYIISVNPSIIFLAGDATVASVAKRSGFANVAAVKNGNVVELNANEASQWGPEFTKLVVAITAEVTKALKK